MDGTTGIILVFLLAFVVGFWVFFKETRDPFARGRKKKLKS